MKIKKLNIILTTLILMLSLVSANAQIDIDSLRREMPKDINYSNLGTEFWFTVPPAIYDETGGLGDKVVIFVTSTTETLVTLEIPGKAINKYQYVSPDQITEFELTPADAHPYIKGGMSSERKEYVAWGSGIHIYADAPLMVYVLVKYRITGDGFLVYPVSTLGTEYIISSYPDASAEYPIYTSLPGITGVVAAFDGTEVEFTLGGNIQTITPSGLKPGDKATEVLNKGDVWLLSTGGKNADLSGSKITSNKPVALVSANQCANIPIDNKYCDFIISQDIPVHSWGKYYHAFSIGNRKYSPILRIYPKEPDTRIYRDDGQLIAQLPEAGGTIGSGYHETRITGSGEQGAAVIWADKPIGVSLFNTGVEEDMREGLPEPIEGDPFQMPLVPVEQYQKDVRFNVHGLNNEFGFPDNYISIVYQTDQDGLPAEDLEIAKVETGGPLNWKRVRYEYPGDPGVEFNYDINGKHFAVKTVMIAQKGIYRLRSNTPFAVYSYGFSGNDAYGYPATAMLSNLIDEDTLSPIPEWNVLCDGSVEGIIKDRPFDDPDHRSNLIGPVFDEENSINYFDFETGRLVPGVHSETTWKLKIKDPTKDARAVLMFSDQAGNDTLIVIEYFAVKLDIEPKVLDFGLMHPGETNILDFKVINLSETGTATINDVNLKFADKGFEILGQNYDFLLPPLEEAEFQVKFNASQEGVFEDSVGVGDTCIFAYKSILKAKVGAPEIFVTDIQFDDFTVDKTLSDVAYIRNNGITRLIVTGYEETNKNEFKLVLPAGTDIDQANPLIVEPGKSFQFNVEFTPSSPNSFNGEIRFFSNASRLDSICTLSGTGINAGLLVRSCNFGERRIHRDNFPVLPYKPLGGVDGIKLDNIGTEPITITGFDAVIANGAEAFLFDSSRFDNMLIGPGESETVDVFFYPKRPGIHEYVISYQNSAGSKAQTYLIGIGTVPKVVTSDITFSPTVVDDENSKSERMVRFTNLGKKDWPYADELLITGFRSDQDGAISNDMSIYGDKGFKLDTSGLNDGFRLMPGDYIDIKAVFLAPEPGNFTADLYSLSDAYNDTASTWNGEGIAQGLKIIPDTSIICFGELDTLLFVVENLGSKELDVKEVSLIKRKPGLDFVDPSVSQGFTIASGGQVPVLISYNPSYPGKDIAELVVRTEVENLREVRSDIYAEAIQLERDSRISPLSQIAKAGEYVKNSIVLADGTDISPAAVKQIDVEINYSGGFLAFAPDKLKVGDQYDGKFYYDDLDINDNIGKTTFTLKRFGTDILQGNGVLAEYSFFTFLPTRSEDIAYIEYKISAVDNSCISFLTQKAMIKAKEVCFNESRKIVYSGEDYQLYQVDPNPVSSSGTDIQFSVGIEGMTRLSLYNINGAHVADLVNNVYEPGRYSVRLPIDELESGVYICRMLSGKFHQAQRIVIAK